MIGIFALLQIVIDYYINIEDYKTLFTKSECDNMCRQLTVPEIIYIDHLILDNELMDKYFIMTITSIILSIMFTITSIYSQLKLIETENRYNILNNKKISTSNGYTQTPVILKKNIGSNTKNDLLLDPLDIFYKTDSDSSIISEESYNNSDMEEIPLN